MLGLETCVPLEVKFVKYSQGLYDQNIICHLSDAASVSDLLERFKLKLPV